VNFQKRADPRSLSLFSYRGLCRKEESDQALTKERAFMHKLFPHILSGACIGLLGLPLLQQVLIYVIVSTVIITIQQAEK